MHFSINDNLAFILLIAIVGSISIAGIVCSKDTDLKATVYVYNSKSDNAISVQDIKTKEFRLIKSNSVLFDNVSKFNVKDTLIIEDLNVTKY